MLSSALQATMLSGTPSTRYRSPPRILRPDQNLHRGTDATSSRLANTSTDIRQRIFQLVQMISLPSGCRGAASPFRTPHRYYPFPVLVRDVGGQGERISSQVTRRPVRPLKGKESSGCQQGRGLNFDLIRFSLSHLFPPFSKAVFVCRDGIKRGWVTGCQANDSCTPGPSPHFRWRLA